MNNLTYAVAAPWPVEEMAEDMGGDINLLWDLAAWRNDLPEPPFLERKDLNFLVEAFRSEQVSQLFHFG